jgi:integrase
MIPACSSRRAGTDGRARPGGRGSGGAAGVADPRRRRRRLDHGQARALLAAVRQLPSGGPLVAFFAVMYYAALRPGEAVELRKEALSMAASSEVVYGSLAGERRGVVT